MPVNTAVYLVPYMDGAWGGFNSLPDDGKLGTAGIPVGHEELSATLRTGIDFMGEAANGIFVYAVHTGIYCREMFLQEPMLTLYRQLVRNGGELAIHPHEEIVGRGAELVTCGPHMREVIGAAYARLTKADLPVAAYRGGHGQYADVVTPILEEFGIGIDLSATPGHESAQWHALWKDAKESAYHLCAEDPAHRDCDHARSRVLEIPLGWDGLGPELAANFLHELADLDTMKRVFDTVATRSEKFGTPQIVHFLCHQFSMSDRVVRERCQRLLEYAVGNGASLVTPSQAARQHAIHDLATSSSRVPVG